MRNLLFPLTLLLSSAAERCPEQHYAVTDDGSTLFSSCGKNILRWNFDGEQTKLEAQHQSISPSCSDEWITKSTCLDSADPLRSFYDNKCPSSSIVKSLQIYDYPKSSSLIVCDDFFGGTFHMFKLNNFPDQRGRPCKDGTRSFFLAKDQRLMEREADDPLVEIGEVFSKIVSDDDGRALLVVAFNVKDDIKRKYAPLSIRRFSEGDNKFQRADEIFSSTETTAFATIDNKIDFNIGVDWDKRPQFHSIIHFPKQKRVIVGYNTYESTSKSRFAHICLLDDENRNLNKKFLEFAVNCGGKTKVTDVLSFEYSWGNNRRSPEKSILFRMSDGSICFQKQSVLENQIQNRLQDRFQNCDKSQWRNVKYSDWIKNNPEDCHPRFKNIKQICDDDFKYTLESMGITAIDSISLVPVQSYSNEGNNHLRIENSFQSWSFSSVKSNEKAYNFIEVIEGENVRRFVASLSPSNSNLYLAEIDSFAEKTIKNSITKNATKWTFDGETVRAEKVNSCDRYSSCESCLAEKSDPTCGWCITTGKCSDFSTCEQNDPAYQSFPRRVKEPRFLSKEAEDYFRQPWSHKCPSLSVREETISYQNLCDKGKSCKGKSFSSIHATVDGLPERRSLLMKELQCRFTKSNSPPVSVPLKNEPIETYSQVGVYEVDCEKPPSDFIASMENSPSSSVKLSLGFAPVQGRDFVSIATADIEVFNCNKLKSCNTCLNPKYNGFCLWCYTDNHCANTKEECPHIKNILKSKSSCPNVQFLDEYVYKRPGMQTISLAASNFRINDDFDLAEADDILVELEYLDVNKNVSGKYAHPGELSFQNQFDDIPASADFEYPVNITIRVNMNGNEVIVDRSAGDNVQVQFDMFECPRIKHSCFGCLNAKPEYGCAYSIKDEKCEISKNGLLSENQVLPLQTCPNPDISKVTPNHLPLNSGPIIVEIEGRNFNPSPVGNSEVFIGNYPCRVVSCTKYGFENPERRNKTCCEFHSKSNIRADGKTNDEVTLSTSADYQVSAKFSSLGVKLGNPKALSYPEFVYSGGFQEFTIRGDFLDAGRHAEIQILGSPCTIIEPRLENEIKCITASYQSIREDSSYLQISSSSPISLSVKQIRDPRLEKFVPDKCIKNEKGSSEVEVQFFEDGHAKAFTFALLKSQDGSEGECRNSDGKLYCRCPYSSGALMGEELNLVITKESKEELKTLKAPESLQTAAEVNVINKEPIIKVTRESNETVSSGSYMIKGGPFCLGWERECEDIPWRLIFRSKENELELNRSSIIVIRNEVISWTPPSFAAYQAVFGSDQDAPSLILKNGEFEIEAVEKIEYESSNMIIIAGGGLGVALVLAIVVFAARKSRRRKERKTAQEKDRLLKGVDRTQKDEAEKYKQHLLGGIQENRPESRMPPTMPFREYRSFILHFMFPPEDEENRLYHRELCPFGTQNSRAGTIDRSMGLQEFKKLLGQREFLLVFIKTLESNSRFTSRDRSKFAAFLMISLQGKLEYATLILQYLIIDMIEKMQPNNLGTLFRHSNTIGEKMLSYWFAMLMYRTVYRRTGEHIFNLFKKLKDLVHSEPVDQITGHSRMTLSEQYLLRVININTNQLSITVLHHEGGEPQFIQISGLYCDTVDQIKERILDTIFWDMEYSKRDSVADYDLEYVDNSLKNPVRRLMKNIDSTSETKDGLRKLNTIDHYHKLFLPNTKKLDFTDKRYLELKPSTSTTMLGQSHQSGSSLSRSRINISDHPSSSNMTGTMGRSGTPLHGETVRDGRQIIDYHHVYDGMSTRKLAAPDHFTLTMIRAKESLETPIQVLIESIVSVVDRQYQMPMCIKYMFDFLDDEFQKVPQRHPDTIHKWKTNSLFLRYWVNLIKNPEFLFDINKSVAVSNSLTVVAQTLIDGCSTTENDPLLAQAQSTSKVLFSKNVHNNFREWVQSYFQEVEMRPEIPRDDFIHFLREENELHIQDFNKNFAIRELFNYAKEYYNDLLTGLNNDRECHQRKFGATLSRCISMSASAPVFAYANNHPVPAPRRVFPK